MRSTFELKHLNNNIPKSPNKANKWPCSKIRNPLCFKLSRGAWIPTSSFRCSAVGATAQALQASTQKITKTRHRFFSAQSLHAQSKSQAVQWSLRAVSSMPSPSSIPFLIATCSEFFGSNRSVITHLKNQSSNGRMVRDIDLKEALGTNRFK